jgi:uncharacterized protein YkwD
MISRKAAKAQSRGFYSSRLGVVARDSSFLSTFMNNSRTSCMRLASLIAVVTLSFGFAVAQPPKDKSKEAFKLSADEQAVLDLVNAERKKANLSPVKINEKLTKAAREHSTNMAKQNKLDHTLDGKGPGDRITATGYKYSTVAENIAMGQKTPADAMQTWFNSTDHKANILGNYTEFGIGIASDANGQRYWTQVFTTPK